MEDVGDRQTNWRGYLDVDSFEDYCEDKLGISVKTGYGLISSYSKLILEQPVYLTDQKLIPPSETKVRILGNKKLRTIEDDSPNSYNKIKEMIFNPDYSRRETEAKLNEIYDRIIYDEDDIEEDLIEYDPLKENVRQYLKGKEDAILGTIRENNQSKFSGLLNGLYDLGQNENSTRVESTEIKRIVITNTAKDSEYAKEVIKRARKLNHKVEVSYTGTGNNDTDILAFPSQLQGAENYWYMKETLFVRERKTPFIETFPSPGDIVENLNTALKLGFHCRSTCHYCYQQKAPYIYQEIFTNFDKLKKEIIYEPFVHRATLVIWSVISFLTERTFNRIPNDLDKSISKFRASAIKAEILDNSSMIQFLPENITQVLIDCKIDFKEQDLKKEIAKIPTYYEMNKKTPLWLWVSEYSDILAIEPIAKQMEFIFGNMANKITNKKIDGKKLPLTIDDAIFNDIPDNNIVRKLAIHRRNILHFRRTIDPQRYLMSNLSHTRKPFLGEDMTLYFDDLNDYLSKLWTIVSTYKDTIDGLHVTVESLINQRTNKVISALTVISVSLLPLTLLAGIYGMNIRLPLAKQPEMIWLMFGALAAGTIIFILILKKKRWL